MSRTAFDRRFPDDDACAHHLAKIRWPEGFVCPACEHPRGWELETKPHAWERAACHRQTSVTAGTVMRRSKPPLRVWFQAIRLLTGRSNGISAEQAQAQLGLGSHKTARLLLHKPRRAMVNPERTMLAGIVEADETTVPFRTQEDPVAGGRSHEGKLTIAGAVEVDDERKPMRLRLEPIRDYGPQDAPEALPRRVRLPLEPATTDGNRLRRAARGRGSPSPRLVGRLRRPARLTRAPAAPGVTFNTPATASGMTREAAPGATPACQAASPA